MCNAQNAKSAIYEASAIEERNFITFICMLENERKRISVASSMEIAAKSVVDRYTAQHITEDVTVKATDVDSMCNYLRL